MIPIYITADTHFNHTKLYEVFGERPADFERTVLSSHHRLPSDCLLIHLGDFCIGKDEETHEAWNKATDHIKHRILLHGNHDKKSDSWYLSHGWDFVCGHFEMRLLGKRILFSHHPQDKRNYPKTDLNIHGHTHGNTHRDEESAEFYDSAYNIEIALEKTNYKPVLLTEKMMQLYKVMLPGDKQ